MLEALLEGKAKPEEIAQFAKCRAKQKIPAIIAALEEHRMSDHHRKMIRFSVEHLRFLEQQILQLDEEIMKKIQQLGMSRNGSSYRRFPVSNKPARPTFWPKLVRICSSLLPRSISVLGRGSVRVTIEAPVKARASRPVAIVGYVQHLQNALGQFPPKRTAT